MLNQEVADEPDTAVVTKQAPVQKWNVQDTKLIIKLDEQITGRRPGQKYKMMAQQLPHWNEASIGTRLVYLRNHIVNGWKISVLSRISDIKTTLAQWTKEEIDLLMRLEDQYQNEDEDAKNAKIAKALPRWDSDDCSFKTIYMRWESRIHKDAQEKKKAEVRVNALMEVSNALGTKEGNAVVAAPAKPAYTMFTVVDRKSGQQCSIPTLSVPAPPSYAEAMKVKANALTEVQKWEDAKAKGTAGTPAERNAVTAPSKAVEQNTPTTAPAAVGTKAIAEAKKADGDAATPVKTVVVQDTPTPVEGKSEQLCVSASPKSDEATEEDNAAAPVKTGVERKS